MGSIPREYEQRCQFDAFYKSVLRNEAWNLKMPRSAVQRRRTKALTGLRTKLAALMPKEG